MTDLSPAIEEAACKGTLARLNSQMRSVLLSSGHLNHVPAGALLYVAEDRPPFVGLIVGGFLRVFVAAPSGRESTIRYVRPGDLLGVVAALSGPSATWVQTLSDSRIWMLDPIGFRRTAQSELSIAWTMAEECARRVEAEKAVPAGTVVVVNTAKSGFVGRASIQRREPKGFN
jgi:CRP-like cAMP-binding protein